MTDPALAAEIDQVFRDEHARVVASLTRRFGDLDIAEDAASEALVAALEHWPADGFPPNPGAWLTTTANRRALDRIRREGKRDAKHQAAAMIHDDTPHEATGPVEDDTLRLMFTCCHPALAEEARVALTLRMLGGLTVEEIARAFLVPETTMAQRITRAKAKIKAANIPFKIPDEADIASRQATVLSVLFLIFNEGYLSGAGDPIRADLTQEAIRLTRLVRTLLPRDAEVVGLLALMVLIESRRPSRLAGGEVVTLAEQDRNRWDADLITEGHELVRACLARVAHGGPPPGRFQILAAINAVHTDARESRDTDWSQIVQLYDRLVAIDSSPIVRLNRAVAVAEVDGPQVALAEVDRLDLAGYHPWHVTRADLLRRLGRSSDAVAEYDLAIGATQNPAEIAYLTRRRSQLG